MPTKLSKLGNKKRTHGPFFDFDRRLFSKKAKAYHHEIHHATSDLIDVYNRAARTHLLSERTAKMMTKKQGLLSPMHILQDFELLAYHLENFWLRAFSYREKICQFINSALDLRFSEKDNLFFKLLNDSIVRKAGLKSGLEKFTKDEILHEVLLKRKMITHRIYYDTPAAGYDRGFRPISKGLAPEKQWLGNMRKEIKLIEKFIQKSFQINDTIMAKLIDYKSAEKEIKKLQSQNTKRAIK